MIEPHTLRVMLAQVQAAREPADQVEVLRAASAHAHAWGLIGSATLADITAQLDGGACRAAADRLVPGDLRYGVWESATGWQAEVDTLTTVEEWLSKDPIGYAVGCASAAGAVAVAAIRALAFQRDISLYGMV